MSELRIFVHGQNQAQVNGLGSSGLNRIVTPEQAQAWLYGEIVPLSWPADLCHTVATEPDRIRAAVAKELRYVAGESKTEIMAYADSIENGADHA